MSPLLECVPNFSEGRDPRVLDRLVAAMSGVDGVACLAHELDVDHHRAVVTLAGAAEPLAEAAFRGARAAIDEIDLRTHAGVHMRMGALDVCPFVPLGSADMQLAVDTARSVARRIGAELGQPVFLYGHAAANDARRVLGAVRNAGFERLRDLVGTDPEFAPDCGPAALHPSAGAVAVGARGILIAYNIQLQSVDVAVAKSIAARVRESSGGLPAVQARGFALRERGRAQVSMNLLDHRRTSIRAVFDAVVQLAEAQGVQVEDSELIGLVPRSALDAETARHVRLVRFDRSQVLEDRLAACGLAS